MFGRCCRACGAGCIIWLRCHPRDPWRSCCNVSFWPSLVFIMQGHELRTNHMTGGPTFPQMHLNITQAIRSTWPRNSASLYCPFLACSIALGKTRPARQENVITDWMGSLNSKRRILATGIRISGIWYDYVHDECTFGLRHETSGQPISASEIVHGLQPLMVCSNTSLRLMIRIPSRVFKMTGISEHDGPTAPGLPLHNIGEDQESSDGIQRAQVCQIFLIVQYLVMLLCARIIGLNSWEWINVHRREVGIVIRKPQDGFVFPTSAIVLTLFAIALWACRTLSFRPRNDLVVGERFVLRYRVVW